MVIIETMNNNTATAAKSICLCAICEKMLFEGDALGDNFVYDFEGDLDYIELAHAACAPAWADVPAAEAVAATQNPTSGPGWAFTYTR